MLLGRLLHVIKTKDYLGTVPILLNMSALKLQTMVPNSRIKKPYLEIWITFGGRNQHKDEGYLELSCENIRVWQRPERKQNLRRNCQKYPEAFVSDQIALNKTAAGDR